VIDQKANDQIVGTYIKSPVFKKY